MSEVRSVRTALAGLLLAIAAGAVLAGLLAMHGLQPSMAGDMPGPLAGSLTVMADAGPTSHESHSTQHQPSAPAPEHDHPGGPLCLGLLVIGLFAVALVLAGFRAWPQPVRTGSPSLRKWTRVRTGRPPPDLFQLSVLRM